MAERVYIETTFVSYLTAWPNRDAVIGGHQQVTREWWDTRRTNYELCVSQLVLDESGPVTRRLLKIGSLFCRR
jgi:hypothetical protein